MRFLLQELHLRERPELLKEILLRSIPYTEADKVVVYVSVQGKKNGYLVENDYAHEFYPAVVAGQTFTAIQMTTASSICVVVDLVMHEQRFKGLLRQEQISLNEFLANRFGHYYAEKLGKAK
jgi:saccharopine dehydrogenase-like NADP-dependent oxidoreductase